jgi:aspartyl-tRNA(Asn)/glutamyl-tRNA(Gln) amidotransferase subunit A
MSCQHHAKKSKVKVAGLRRREVLRHLGAASAILAVAPILPRGAAAQSKLTVAGDLPRTIEEASKRFRDRSVGVVELTQTYLKGALALRPKLNPFITVTDEEALKTAAVLDSELARGTVRGPLHGIPIVYKDNIDTAGTLTTVGSEFFSTRIPATDAHVVSRLKQAGAIMIAKANMNEFAAGVAGRNKYFGDAHNPWDVNRWPGGSSSGTGVSIASGLCLGGLGTDTGVSVRGPAGWLGLVGMRPSYGRVSVRGTFPRAYSFDTVGPLAHSVADAAALLQVISDYDENDRYAVHAPSSDFTAELNGGVKGLRLGIVDEFTYRNVDVEVAQAVAAAAEHFGKLGAAIKPVKIPLLSGKIDFKYPLTILLYEFNQILGDTYRKTDNKSLFGPVVHANIAQAEKISKETYEAAVKQRPAEIAEIRQVFSEVDAFITPTHPFVAPPVTVDAEADPGVRQFTVPVSFTGFPAISLPCGFNSSGLPIGLQIVANDFQEQLLFRIANAFERTTDYHTRRPSLFWDGRT